MSALITRLRSDHLLRGSLFLMTTTIVAAGLGFGFWLLVARLYNAEEVGLMTSLVNSSSLLAYLSLFGMNSLVTRYLPRSKNPSAMVSTAFVGVLWLGLILSLLYLLGIPLFAPKLEFVLHNTGYALAFVIFATLGGVNLFTDSVFVAKRAAHFNAIIDGFVQGAVRLIAPLALLTLGAFGIFISYGLGGAVAVVASLYFLRRSLRLKVRRPNLAAIRGGMRYSFGNYINNTLYLIPIMVLPLIVLQTHGSAQSAYFFVAFQVANLLYSASHAVGETLLAEASQPGAELSHVMKRSARIMAMVQVPGVVMIVALSPLILAFFGHDYVTNGKTVLIALTLGSIAVSVNTWTTYLLKVTNEISALNCSYAIYIAVIIGLSIYWSDRSLVYIAFAWALGHTCCAIVGGSAVIAHVRAKAHGQNRTSAPAVGAQLSVQ